MNQISTLENGRKSTWFVDNFDVWPEAYSLRWLNFSPQEMASKCGSPRLLVDARLMDALEALRGMVEAPMIVESGYRTFKYNASIGGTWKSQHVRGRAADILVPHLSGEALAKLAKNVTAFREACIGVHINAGLVHLEVGSKRARWWRTGDWGLGACTH